MSKESKTFLNFKQKTWIMFFGILLTIVLSIVIGFTVNSVLLFSFGGQIVSNIGVYGLAGIWVGWRLKSPSLWTAVLFAMLCFGLTLFAGLIVRDDIGLSLRAVILWVILVVSALLGVLAGGYISVRSKNSTDGK